MDALDSTSAGLATSLRPINAAPLRLLILKVALLAAGGLAFLVSHAGATVRYVDVNGTNSTPPYTNWSTAAVVIQDAVDVADPGDLVLVTNGLYQTGGRAANGTLPNRVSVAVPLTLQSANGPLVTFIQGNPAGGALGVRCAYLTNGALLSGFTLTSGSTHTSFYDGADKLGGGAYCEAGAVVSNCVFTGNSAYEGGGASDGTLIDCTLQGNGAARGGAAEFSTLNHCIVSGNQAMEAGGVAFGVLNDCTLESNYSARYGAATHMCTLSNCTLLGNWADGAGGGASYGTLINCTLLGNGGSHGGGAFDSYLTNCVLLTNSASAGGAVSFCGLDNCRLAGNTASLGGGTEYGGLNNCVLVGNLASEGAGAWCGSLNNCLVTGNSADSLGGGGFGCTLNNCTVVSNSATSGGGINGGTANNCIVYYNSGSSNANFADATLAFSCTTPAPASGSDNFDCEPLLVNLAGGDFRLQTNSPCINAGNNNYAPAVPDLDANPRVRGGTVDVGAYEFQSPASSISYAWLMSYGLAMDGSADLGDPDGDGLNNSQEWVANTHPTNSASNLRLLSLAREPAGVSVTWTSVSNRVYLLEGTPGLGSSPAFSAVATNLAGAPGTTTYLDTNAPASGRLFYRVRAQFGPPAPPPPPPEAG
jgi:hypothetical protein